VALCREDYYTLNNYLNDVQVNGRRIRVSTWYRDPNQNQAIPAPYTAEELKERGFDGYALDFLECPEELKYFLQTDMNLHRIVRILPLHRFCSQC
jgi:hypothetical protein